MHVVIRRTLWSRGVRAFADGYVSILLPIYLLELGFGAWEVGVIATTTLLGSGALTLAVGLQAHRFRYRTVLVGAAFLMAGSGFAFASVTDFWPLLAIAFVGTLNPSSGGVSVFLPMEHSVISSVVGDSERTAVFARYSLIGSLVAALGALFAGVPQFLSATVDVSTKAALQAMFVLYGVCGVGAALIYARLPRDLAATREHAARPLQSSRRMVYKLAALFSIDSFAGGLILDSMLVLWLYDRFQLSTALAGTIFFWTGVLSSISYLVAVRIARRIGLVNTMVVHASPVEPLSHPRPVHADAGLGDRAAPCAQRAFADGRSDAHVVRDGDRAAGGTARGSKHHLRAAKLRSRPRTRAGGILAKRIGIRVAARCRRHAEDHV